MKRYHVIVEGRVQGVGFRGFTQLNATKLGLTGSVRNMANGMVEIFVQGEEEALAVFLQVIEKGNRWSSVEQVHIKEMTPDPQERSFRYDFLDEWY